MAYAVTTLATLRQRVQERLIANFWVTAELNYLINEALRMWGSLTGFYRQRTQVTFGANNVYFNINQVAALDDTYAILRIDLSSSPGPYHLDPIGVMEQGQFNPTWQNNTATAPTSWIPMGLNLFAFYPIPTNNPSCYVDNLYYAPLPANDSAYIQVGEEDMDAIIDYIQFAAVLKEGGQELQAVMPCLQNFLKQAAKYNSRLLHSAIFRNILGMPGGGQEDTRPKDLESQAPR